MDASNIQPYQHCADYNLAYDGSIESSSARSPYRPLHPAGQPLAQHGAGVAAHGTQALVLDLLKARAAALSTMQNEAMRTSAFETLVASVCEHDEQQRPGAMHAMLAQVPGLPSESRGDALNNLLLLSADDPSALPARDSRPALDSRIETDVAGVLSVSTHHGAFLERC
ncbi:hypothetical protein KTQ42_05565|uniref:hypothetical protein n=1 Tax=Noviherbaspirillum sp. L7-7A TaxID=2850560 RepID=UPI001C2C1915|nr:hypothetical protein [Noviherbaspirillum sp. L7-7A]MBV0878772.1 hypothetical protein [Noviherbaspirillum sp. L7-7A]